MANHKSNDILDEFEESRESTRRDVTVKLGGDVIPILASRRREIASESGKAKRESYGQVATRLLARIPQLVEEVRRLRAETGAARRGVG